MFLIAECVAGQIAFFRLGPVVQGIDNRVVFFNLKVEVGPGGVARGAGDAQDWSIRR